MKKKISILLLGLCIAFASQAQIKFGVLAGGVAANGKLKGDIEGHTNEINMKSRLFWKAGVVAMVDVAPNISIFPQLNVVTKGGKYNQTLKQVYEGTELEVTADAKTQLTFLELPVNIVYSQPNFWAGIGPSISYGISGKSKSHITIRQESQVLQDIHQESKTKFDGKEDPEGEEQHLKPLEFGANITAGYKFDNGFFIHANYNHGMSSISTDAGSSWKNRYVSLGIGYFFKN